MPNEFMRLKPGFLASFNWKSAAGSRSQFTDWARKKNKFRVSEHDWKPLKEGKPVPRTLVEAFSAFISDEMKSGRFPVNMIADPCNPPSKESKELRLPNHWRLGWLPMFAAITENPALPEEAYCSDEDDLRMAADMIMRSVAARTDPRLSGQAAMDLAQREMSRTLDEYVTLLLKLWKANANTIIFTMDGTDRIGVSVVAPLAEPYFNRFRYGNSEDMDILENDLSQRSEFLFHMAASENRNIDIRGAKAKRGAMLAKTVIHQFAECSVPQVGFNARLLLISLVGNEESRSRLEAFYYQPVGTKTPVTNKEIMEFGQPPHSLPKLEYATLYGQYLALKSMLMIYQAYLSDRERILDS